MYLKKITYKGVDYLYEVNTYEDITKFYDSKPIEYWGRKYWFFGPRVLKKKYNFLFIFYCDIENPRLKKEYIQSKFDYELEIISRKEEIEKGKIL